MEHSTSRARRLAALVVGVGLAAVVAAGLPVAPAPAHAAPASPLKRAWFYNAPPVNTAFATDVASQSDLVVMGKGQSPQNDDNVFATNYLQPAGKATTLYTIGNEVQGPGRGQDGSGAWLPLRNSGDACSQGNFSAAPATNNIAWSFAQNTNRFCLDMHGHESWFLHSAQTGERLYGFNNITGGFFYYTNPADPGWRQYAAAWVGNEVNCTGTISPCFGGGVYLDDVWLSGGVFAGNPVYVSAGNLSGLPKEFSQTGSAQDACATDDASTADFRCAERWYVHALAQKVHSAGKPLWGNIGFYPGDDVGGSWNLFLDQPGSFDGLNGGLGETFTGWGGDGTYYNDNDWNRILTQADQVLSSGHGYVAVVTGDATSEPWSCASVNGNPNDLANCTTPHRQQYGYASYLMVADGKQAYFRYTDPSYAKLMTFSDYSLAIGMPLLDPATGQPQRYAWRDAWGISSHLYKSDGNGVYERPFTCGTVTLNTSDHTSSLTVNPSLPTCGGSPSPGSTLKVYAAGTSAFGAYPTMRLVINGAVAQTWTNVQGNPGAGQFVEYDYSAPTPLDIHAIRLQFANDAYDGSVSPPQDRNLFVQKITLDGVDYPTDAPSTYEDYVAPGCGSSGYYQTQELGCTGQFAYAAR